MTCKTCVHYEVCESEIEAHHDNPRDLEVDGIEEHCGFFKPKSRFVELPCEVGQECYFVYETDNETMFIDKGKVQSFSVDNCGIWFRAIYENLSSYWHTALSIGDTVFLSREEAENALKERERNEKV